MPFDDKKEFQPKTALKQMPGQKSMFDDKPKPPSPQEFQQRVQEVQNKDTNYLKTTNELYQQIMKVMKDKTLEQNRNVFGNEAIRDVIQKLITLGNDLNSDPDIQQDSYGSITLITMLFKICLFQKDQIHSLEYSLSDLQKRTTPQFLSELIKKEITLAIDTEKQKI